jgi:hypothetical protein
VCFGTGKRIAPCEKRTLLSRRIGAFRFERSMPSTRQLPPHIALNHVDISANKEAISNALSRIKSLSISVSPCEQIGDVVEGTRAVLQVLFVNHRIRRLCLDLLDRKHPKLMESDQLLAMIIDTQRCTRLRTLDISGRSTDPTRGDIVRMLEPHTASLRELYLFIRGHTKNHQLSGATNCREAWRSVLQTSPTIRCYQLPRSVEIRTADIIEMHEALALRPLRQRKRIPLQH